MCCLDCPLDECMYVLGTTRPARKKGGKHPHDEYLRRQNYAYHLRVQEGLGRIEVARIMDVSTTTVTKLVKARRERLGDADLPQV